MLQLRRRSESVEVAVVRGAVEANRIAEGENLYVDEEEPGTEKLQLPQNSTMA